MNSNNLNSALKVLFDNFKKNPYNYLCEFDIHAELFTLLRNELNDLTVNIDYNYDNYSIYKKYPGAFSLVRNEYYVDNKRLDIAILNKDKFKSDKFEINGNPLYSEEVDIGIEIKFNAFDLKYSSINDIIKLSELLKINKINIGISILFSHYETISDDYSSIKDEKLQSIIFDIDKLESNKYKYVHSFIITPENMYYRIIDAEKYLKRCL